MRSPTLDLCAKEAAMTVDLNDVYPHALTNTALPGRRRVRLVAVAVVALLAVASCSSTGKRTNTTGETVHTLPGSYTLVGDVGGTQVKAGATITLTLKPNGTLTVHAVQPGQTLDDTGTWSVGGSTIKITVKDMGLSGQGPYTYDGRTLVLPILIFGSGKGTSRWTRIGTGGGSTTPPVIVAGSWDDWDLTEDAVAAGMKAYDEARASGAGQEAAVAAAVEVAKQNPNVADVHITDNKINAIVRYQDGTLDYLITERLEAGGAGGFLDTRADPATCATLPAAPAGDEPGREAVNPSGGFGVTVYDPKIQQKPLTSADTPTAKRALLVAAEYDTPDRGGDTIRDSAGNNIECLEASLTKAGYQFDTVLGKIESGKPVMTGEQAAYAVTDDLLHNTYGVMYFVGHGAWISSWKPWVSDSSSYSLGFVNFKDPDLAKVINGRKLNRNVLDELGMAITDKAGLAWNKLDPPFFVGAVEKGLAKLWIRPPFFKQLRDIGRSFSSTLLMFNSCNSGRNPSLAKAAQPKVFFGWKSAMNGDFISDAAETIFDSLTDKVRTARDASQLWQLHQIWADNDKPANDNVSARSLVALGANQTPYPPLSGQSHIFIFFGRNAPSSATADLEENTLALENCWKDVWSVHAGALVSPVCTHMTTGATITKEDVDQALFELGRSLSMPFGRWTLND
jgi:hypothetical protein